jgi:hypothetical protein
VLWVAGTPGEDQVRPPGDDISVPPLCIRETPKEVQVEVRPPWRGLDRLCLFASGLLHHHSAFCSLRGHSSHHLAQRWFQIVIVFFVLFLFF